MSKIWYLKKFYHPNMPEFESILGEGPSEIRQAYKYEVSQFLVEFIYLIHF
jgi:hypothetical protein